MSEHEAALREELVSLLKGGGAHVHFMDAIENFPAAKRGTYAQGLAHTGWQLLEHARIAQWDILEFSRNHEHVSPEFPEGYWPKTPAPASEEEWNKTVEGFKHDLREMIKLITRESKLAPVDAYTLCSIAADVHVTQLVNVSKGAHVMLAKSALREAAIEARFSQARRRRVRMCEPGT